jgi:uncharacterized membrane protein YkvA (DUF1232 family)
MKRLKDIAQTLKNEVKVYQLVLRDKRTPLLGKVFLGLAIGYFFMPFDLIPDFIPVLGGCPRKPQLSSRELPMVH